MKLAIFGASGFSREVRDIALNTGYEDIVFIDKTKEVNIEDFPLVVEEDISSLVANQYRFIIGIGSTRVRKEIWDRFPELDYANIIDPTANYQRLIRGRVTLFLQELE